MFTRAFTKVARSQIRANSTAAKVEVKSTIPEPTNVFTKLSDINPEELYGSKPFGGSSRSYHIKRTKYGHLPVYATVKSKAYYTEVRKISGNVIQFRTDLIAALPKKIPAKEVKIVQQSNKILIKGNYVEQIKEVLNIIF